MRLMIAAVLVVVSSANLAPLFKHEDRVENEYIIVLKYDGNLDTVKNWATNDLRIHIQREYRTVLKGFHARISEEAALNKVRQRSDVLYVEEDMVVRALQVAESWGLDRVDQRYLPLDGLANFTNTGQGVNAYIIDTGIYTDNTYFEGRASISHDVFGDSGIDCNGHGTHCAGTVGSSSFGIARKANLFGVRVLNCEGAGTGSGVLEGVEWVGNYHQKPAVASMSLGADGVSTVIDDSIRGLINRGVSVSVAAGNDDRDACYVSPARVPQAITVGATAIYDNDIRADFSNYGSCVDIFAPGVDILSTWIGYSGATHTISGTSMACPHVTGAACLLLEDNPNLSPSQVKDIIVDSATPDIIWNLSGTNSPNKLLYIETYSTAVRNNGHWLFLCLSTLLVVKLSH